MLNRGSIITEAGVHPNVVGLVYVAAHAPAVGEDEGELGAKTPSVLAKTEVAIKKTPDDFTYLNPADFPKLFAPDLPQERRNSNHAPRCLQQLRCSIHL